MTPTRTYGDRPEQPAPAPHFFPVRAWAVANGLGVNAVYEYIRRERDPLPHISQGRRRLIDDAKAAEWLRRNFGHPEEA